MSQEVRLACEDFGCMDIFEKLEELRSSQKSRKRTADVSEIVFFSSDGNNLKFLTYSLSKDEWHSTMMTICLELADCGVVLVDMEPYIIGGFSLRAYPTNEVNTN